MVSKLKIKGEVGKKSLYISRNKVLRKLQISLSNFRRLCIYKGIFPREIDGKSRFHKKDIIYMSHDPLIFFFHSEKAYKDKIKKAKAKDDKYQLNHLISNKPKLNLDHIIKDRYPSFDDVLKDLDDVLSLLFVFAHSPPAYNIPVEFIHESRRLTTEFLHYIITSKTLRKVFISVKGYYFQANIMGADVTWIIPHNFVTLVPKNVDLKIMKSFIEFYLTLMAFVNCHLFNSINIIYPPKILGGIHKYKSNEKVSNEDLIKNLLNCLNLPLKSSINALPSPPKIDKFEDIEEVDQGLTSVVHLSTIFEGKKFFISREVPKEPFILAIRSFGGVVSWQDDESYGQLYGEDDLSITYQIIDRPSPSTHYIGRVYIQPQWIFDSINAGRCLPCDHYLPNAKLPPHASPFIIDKHSHLMNQFKQSTEAPKLKSTEPQKELTSIERKFAVQSLPRKKQKLYKKLQLIKKTKEKIEKKLETKKGVIKSKNVDTLA